MRRYRPTPPTTASLEELAQWVFSELERLRVALQTVQLQELHAPPAKPRSGMVVLADGTDWNPGAGRGIYWYDEATASWLKMG